MQAIDPIDAREAEIERIAQSREETAALQQHLREIIQGAVFKGSYRSCQFLTYVVDQAIAGHYESLKERVIGVELFERSTSYDTSNDAIVRVTASDVRKRLLQHYGKYGSTSEYRINLLSGSYIPEITRALHVELNHQIDGNHQTDGIAVQTEASTTPQDSGVRDQEHEQVQAHTLAGSSDLSDLEATQAASSTMRRWFWLLILMVTLNAGLWAIFIKFSVHPISAASSDVLWPALFNPAHTTHLITSDPNIIIVQEITGSVLTLSDYANHQYIPASNGLTPDQIRYSQLILSGDNSSAALDPPITANIAALAQQYSRRMDVRAARSIQLTDLKNDDSFIFLGSPRSDPWSELYSDELDFRFVYDKAISQEIVQNVHPRANELTTYVPTAKVRATGQSYAIVAFIQNLDQSGQVLLLAGASREGTEAAGRFASDLPRLSDALKRCGIPTTGPLHHFELVLRVNTMAGSSNTADVVACHMLSAGLAQKL
jgi:hypothetical protein